jgi:ribose transport system substrate-binding protein
MKDWIRQSPADGGSLASAAILLLVLGLLSVGLAACGGSSSSSSDSSTSAATSTTSNSPAEGHAELASALEEDFEGVFEKPPAKVPKAVPGKDVWMMSCGQKFPVCVEVADEFKKASEALGWNFTVFDTEGNPDKANSGIRQAIAAGADGIASIAFDCATIKGGLLAAKEAGVPVVNYVGVDCPGEPLFTSSVHIQGSDEITKYTASRGAAAAAFTVGLMEERGLEGGEILAMEQKIQIHHKAYWDAWTKEIEKLCPSCEITEVEFTNEQVPNPANQIWKTALLAHPDAPVIAFNSDAYLESGLGADIQAADPSHEKIVCCGSGEGLEWLRNGVATALEYWPYGYDSWSAADELNEIFAGVKPEELPNQGGGFIFVDKEHNMPEGEDPIEVPFDYRKMREEAWKKG